MQGALAEGFSWLCICPGSSGFRLTLAQEPAVPYHARDLHLLTQRTVKRGGLQPSRAATLDWLCVFVQMKEQAETPPLGDGCMAGGDRFLMLDITLGKIKEVLIQDSLTCGATVCL